MTVRSWYTVRYFDISIQYEVIPEKVYLPSVTMQRYYIIIDYVCFPYCTCHPHNSPEHVSLGESKLLPTSLGGSLRTEGGFDSGSFQMTASALGLGAGEI